MVKNVRIAMLLGVLLVPVGQGVAATIDFSGAIMFTNAAFNTNSPPPAPITLSLFDPTLGALTAIAIEVQGLARGSLDVTNNSLTNNAEIAPTDVDVNANRLGVSFQVNDADTTNRFNFDFIASDLISPFILAPQTSGTIEFGGGDTGGGTSAMASTNLNDGASLTAFTGPGNFDIDVIAAVSNTITTSGGNPVLSVPFSQGSLTASVTYTYTPSGAAVPAPATLWLLSLGGLGGIGWRRHGRRSLQFR